MESSDQIRPSWNRDFDLEDPTKEDARARAREKLDTIRNGAVELRPAGRYWGRWRAARRWQRREFFHHLTVSLNTIYERDGTETLGIRTILEKATKDVFLNPIAAEQFERYAQQTTDQMSIVRIPEVDRWHLLNAVLNEVAEKFAQGMVDRDMGLPVQTTRYVLFLTREVDGDVRTHKPRAMLARKDHLLAGRYDSDDAPLALESPHHQKRVRTLREARVLLEAEPDHFMELEIARPVFTPVPGSTIGA